MTDVGADPLDEAAANFASELHETLSNTFPGPFAPFNVLVSEGKGGHRNVLITQEPRLGVDLKAVDGDRLFTVQLKYKCTWDGDYPAVEESEFKIGLSGVSEPLLRFDYLRHPLGGLAGAHVNVHAHRDEFVYAMARAGKKEQLNSSGLSIPKLSHLHIPVGGKRFRPCLEDILEFLATDFKLHTLPGFRDHLATGRRLWRERQLRAMSRRHPLIVADALRALGAEISWPQGAPVAAYDDALGAY